MKHSFCLKRSEQFKGKMDAQQIKGVCEVGQGRMVQEERMIVRVVCKLPNEVLVTVSLANSALGSVG